MTFRTEEKYFCEYNNVGKVFNWLRYINAKKIYPKRYISSLYFDTFDNKLLIESEEGIVPRKKIRFRSYQKHFDFEKEIFKEIKITSVEGKFKITEKIQPNKIKTFLNNGLYLDDYGVCEPKIYVTYLRDYMKFENIRLTIDRNISYKAYDKFYKKNIFQFNDHNMVIEIKCPINTNHDILNLFSLSKRRFSKYARGMMYIKGQIQNIIN